MNLPAPRDAALELDGHVAMLSLRCDDVRNALTGSELVNDNDSPTARVGECEPRCFGVDHDQLAQRQRLEELLDACSAFQALCHKIEDH